MKPAGRIAAIASATLGRVGFGMAFSLVVLLRLPAAESAQVFQLMVLQAVFSTFLSGSAFVRGLSDAGQEGQAAAGLRALVLTALGFAAIAALAVGLLPAAFRAAYIAGDVAMLAPLALGGLGVALVTALQGNLVDRIGPWRAFLPMAAGFGAMALVLLVVPVGDGWTALWCLAAAQCLPLAILLAAERDARRLMLRALGAGHLPALGAQYRETLAFGATNAAALLIVFALRAYWWDSVGPEVAERVFFTMRVSDMWLQVAFYALAMSRRLRGEERLAAPRGRGGALRWAAIALAAGILVIAAALVGAGPAAGAASMVVAVAGLLALQFLVDLCKLPSAVILITTTRERQLARFAVLSVVPQFISALLAAAAIPYAGAAALLCYQAGAALGIVLGWLAMQRHDPGRAAT